MAARPWPVLLVLWSLTAGCGNRVEWLPPESEDPFDQDHDLDGSGSTASGGAMTDDPTSGGATGGAPTPPAPWEIVFDVEIPDELAWPDSCEARWQYLCESYDPMTNCGCNTALPVDIETCGGYGALYCNHFFRGGYDVWVECQCVPQAPSTAEDCPNPASFVCDHPSPTGPSEQCRCG